MGRRRRKENSTLQNTKNSIEDLVEKKDAHGEATRDS
jgi:hypothetical protein